MVSRICLDFLFRVITIFSVIIVNDNGSLYNDDIQIIQTIADFFFSDILNKENIYFIVRIYFLCGKCTNNRKKRVNVSRMCVLLARLELFCFSYRLIGCIAFR